jgi:hypothetical protein
MASAIPAAIGVGTSLIGGIQGKGAAKKQQQLAEQQLRQLQPLINAQIAASQFGLGQAQQLYPEAADLMKQIFGQSQGAYGEAQGLQQTALTDYKKLLDDALGRSSELYGAGRDLMGQGGQLAASGRGILEGGLPYLGGAAAALSDLQKFYRPFMDSGQRAIDRFLPGSKQIQDLYATELGNVNQGYRSASENIAKFAPRGGGRVSTLARADIDRQKGISDVYAGGKQNLLQLNLNNAFQGAQGQQGIANALAQLGLGQGQLGLGTIGAGLNTTGTGLNAIGAGTNYLGTGGGLAQNAFGQGLNAFGQGLNALGLGLNAGQGLGGLASSAMGQGLSGGNTAAGLYGQQANRAYGYQPQTGGGNALGGYLVDLFKDTKIQNSIGDFFSKLFGKGNSGSSTSIPGLPSE